MYVNGTIIIIIAKKYGGCSRDEGTKDFTSSNGIHFGWETVEDVYRADIVRAKCRRVPKLKYSYILCDAWTRLNVMPAKIMQVISMYILTWHVSRIYNLLLNLATIIILYACCYS